MLNGGKHADAILLVTMERPAPDPQKRGLRFGSGENRGAEQQRRHSRFEPKCCGIQNSQHQRFPPSSQTVSQAQLGHELQYETGDLIVLLV